jgi:hypothetical protein
MQYTAVSGLMMAAVIGNAVAGPTHMHIHERAHAKKDVQARSIDWNNIGVDWVSAWSVGQAQKTASVAAAAAPVATTTQAAAPVATTTKAAAAVATSAAVFVEEAVSSVANIVLPVIGVSNNLKSFGAASAASGALGDSYIANVGTVYGSNIIKVSSATGYDFTLNFVNSQKVPIVVNVWNKVGPDHQPQSGPMLAPKSTTLTFAIAAGGSQMIAVQENSSIGWAQTTTKITSYGAYDSSWGEATLKASGSGYDLSAIPNTAGNKYNMSISSTETTCISDPTQNYWLTDTQPIGTSDGSCFIAQSTAHIKVVMGGNM